MALIYHILYIFTVLLNFILAGNILIYKYKTRAVWMFFGLMVNLTGWITSLYLFYAISQPEFVYITGKMNFIFVLWMMYFLIIFVYEFPKKVFYIKALFFKILFVETLIYTIITLFTPLVDQAELIVGVERVTIYGPLYFWFIIHFIIYFFPSMAMIGYKFWRFRGLERLQIAYILIGVAVSFLLAATTNILIPFVFKYYDSQNLGVLASLILNFSIFYAVMRHRLFDIKLFAKRAFVKIISSALVIGFFLAIFFAFKSLGQEGLTVQVIFVFLAFIIYPSIEKKVVDIFDRTSILQMHSAEKTITKILKKLPLLIDVDAILDYLFKIMEQNMALKNISIILFGEIKGKKLPKYQVITKKGFVKDYQPLIANKDFYKDFITNQEIIIGDEIRYFISSDFKRSSLKQKRLEMINEKMEKNNIGIVLPLLTKNKMIGMIEIGRKSTEDAFTKEDIELLTAMANQSSIALENAILYEQMKDFNKVLQERVVEATGKLRKANKKLRELDRAKSEFVSIVSHQLRAPLTATSGYVAMLLDGDLGSLNGKLKKVVHKISAISNRSKIMIEDLLSLSRIESGKIEYKFEHTKFNDIVKNITEDYQLVAKEKGLEVKYNENDPNIMVNIDVNKIRQVVLNLIDNAVKYTIEGEVNINLTKDNKKVTFSVCDTGVGIDPSEAKKLFRKFRRTGKSNNIKGTGLGLYIAKQFVAAHKGKIWVESEGEGEGSCFYVQLDIVK